MYPIIDFLAGRKKISTSSLRQSSAAVACQALGGELVAARVHSTGPAAPGAHRHSCRYPQTGDRSPPCPPGCPPLAAPSWNARCWPPAPALKRGIKIIKRPDDAGGAILGQVDCFLKDVLAT